MQVNTLPYDTALAPTLDIFKWEEPLPPRKSPENSKLLAIKLGYVLSYQEATVRARVGRAFAFHAAYSRFHP